MRIWRAGCIIQSDGISDFLDPLLNKPDFDGHNLLQVPEIAAEIGKTYASLKKLVAMSVEADAVIPAFSATLEWMKSVGGKDLPVSPSLYTSPLFRSCIPPLSSTYPIYLTSACFSPLPQTSFEEMELDYFGHHNYDLKRDPQEGTKKGSHQ
jgi:6-phosphogluconate dehydrogenase